MSLLRFGKRRRHCNGTTDPPNDSAYNTAGNSTLAWYNRTAFGANLGS